MEFEFATETTERSSSLSTFEYRKRAVREGIQKLESLIERLPLALPASEDAAGIKSLKRLEKGNFISEEPQLPMFMLISSTACSSL